MSQQFPEDLEFQQSITKNYPKLNRRLGWLGKDIQFSDEEHLSTFQWNRQEVAKLLSHCFNCEVTEATVIDYETTGTFTVVIAGGKWRRDFDETKDYKFINNKREHH